MRRIRTIAAIVACTSVAGGAFVIAVVSDSAAVTAAQPAPLGASTAREVGDMLQAFDAANVEQSIRTLAGFGTRSTLSSQDDPKRGIGAARDWIFKEFQKSAARSGGRMTVELQSFIAPAGPRVPAPDEGHERRRHAARQPGRRRPAGSTSSAATTTRAAPTC